MSAIELQDMTYFTFGPKIALNGGLNLTTKCPYLVALMNVLSPWEETPMNKCIAQE